MTSEDLDFAWKIACKFSEHSPFVKAGISFDEDAVKQVVQICIDQGGAFRGDNGLIIGILSPIWANTKHNIALELGWWGEGEGLPLLKAFEQWATENNAAFIQMSTLGAAWDERTAKIFTRMNYNKSEQSWLKGLI